MNAEAVLKRLETLGITIEAEGHELYIEPIDAVPDDLMDELIGSSRNYSPP